MIPHTCDLPWRYSPYHTTGLPLGTIQRCPDCQRPWYVRKVTEKGWRDQWYPIRWYHFRLRKKVTR